jgi:Aspartyl/Asparaginyl beta-hydroxylase
LLDHLVGTYEIARRWDQPVHLQHGALIHSVYGTDVFQRQLLPLAGRDELRRVAGERAERVAYLFSVVPRDILLAGTHLWAPGAASSLGAGDRYTADQSPPTREELDGLVLLHMANMAEQAQEPDGSPGRWLVRLREIAELLIGSDTVTLPLFIAELAGFSDEDEVIATGAYRTGVAGLDQPDARSNRLALAAATCPVIAEPCIWQAHLSRCRGDLAMAESWARRARRRLLCLGAAWDKRLAFDDWLALTRLLERAGSLEPPASAIAIADPRVLLEALTSAEAGQNRAPAPAEPDPAVGVRRFERYVEALSEADGPALRGVYPDLASQPWYDPAAFPLANYLRTHSQAIRKEILALEPARFHPESERIGRTGEWDVLFLYERGRRHDDVCEACPVTTDGIETHSAMRTMAGLIYVSRMRAGTHIRAHRGPTNLRLRCHLGIKVPEGDCAIRVAEETRSWREGECLVFDDYFEHEAWNHAEGDRIVLIIDLWHPGLSATEVRLLGGLQRYAYAHARRLGRYWSANAAAAAGSSDS